MEVIMKKLIAILLTITLLITPTATLSATDDNPNTGRVVGDWAIVFNSDGQTLQLLSYLGNDKEVVIPREIEGATVTVIGMMALQNKNIASVTIPDTITSIGNGSFAQNPELVEVIIPDSVLTIGEGAFAFNESLARVTLSKSITHIGALTLSQTAIESIVIPDSVVSIGSSAFAGNEKLTSITFGNSLERIEDSVFWNTGASELTFPDSLTFIGSSAFNFNQNLESVTFGSGAAVIGASAFGMTEKLSTLDLGGVVRIENAAFMNSNLAALKEVVIPASVEFIGSGTFLGAVEKVTFEGETPPEFSTASFPWWLVKTVHVPEAAIDAYKALEFANIDDWDFEIVAIDSGDTQPPEQVSAMFTRVNVAQVCEVCGVEKSHRVATMTLGDEVVERRAAKRTSQGEVLGVCEV